MRFFKLVHRNLFRNRLRTLLTIALLATIFFFVTVMMGILHGLTAVTPAGANRLVVQNAMSVTTRLPFSHEKKIRQLPGIVEICKQQWVGNYYKDKRNLFTNYAVDHDRFATVFDDYRVDPKQLADWSRDRLGALVGPELMQRFGWKIGQRITLTHNIYPYDLPLTIRGVYDHPVNRASLYFHMDYYNETLKNRSMVGNMWIKVRNPGEMAALSQQIDAMFKNSEYPTETYTEKDYQASLVSWMGNVELLFKFISGCAIAMVIMLAAITMSMSARERVAEIAVLKTIGFGTPLVLAILLAEFLLLALLGGMLGTIGAKALAGVLDITKLTGGSVHAFAITWPLVGGCALLAIAVGAIAGGFPAARAANLSVVDALRKVV